MFNFFLSFYFFLFFYDFCVWFCHSTCETAHNWNRLFVRFSCAQTKNQKLQTKTKSILTRRRIHRQPPEPRSVSGTAWRCTRRTRAFRRPPPTSTSSSTWSIGTISHRSGIAIYTAPFTLKKMSLSVRLSHRSKQGWYRPVLSRDTNPPSHPIKAERRAGGVTYFVD